MEDPLVPKNPATAPASDPEPAKSDPKPDEDLLAYLDVPAQGSDLLSPPKLEFDIELPSVNPESELAAELGGLRPAPVGQKPEIEVEKPDRYLPNLKVNLSEQQLADQLSPTFQAAHPSEGSLAEMAGPASGPAEPVIQVIKIDDTPREAPPTRPSRPRRFWRVLGDIWDGPLGWAEKPSPSAVFVAAKVGLRVALFGILPIALALGVGFLSQGALYGSHPATVGDTSLLWARGVVAFQPPDQPVQINDGTFVSGRLLDHLSSLYGQAWVDIGTAVASGDTSPLTGVLSGSALDTYQRQAAQAHANGWHLQLYGPGQYRDQLLFLTANPVTAPSSVTAFDGYISIYLVDSAGHLISSVDYSGVEATFLRDSAGNWRLDAISFDSL